MLINHQNHPYSKANSGIDSEVINMITITYDRYSVGGWSLKKGENHNDCKEHKSLAKVQ